LIISYNDSANINGNKLFDLELLTLDDPLNNDVEPNVTNDPLNNNGLFELPNIELLDEPKDGVSVVCLLNVLISSLFDVLNPQDDPNVELLDEPKDGVSNVCLLNVLISSLFDVLNPQDDPNAELLDEPKDGVSNVCLLNVLISSLSNGELTILPLLILIKIDLLQ